MPAPCSTCGFALWIPLGRLGVSTVGLYDDARFPGRCIVALIEHYEHLDDIGPELACQFLADVQVAGRVLREVTQAPRINYAVLGNVEPHVHAHVIPRALGPDPAPGRPPWESSRPHEALEPSARKRLERTISAALGAAHEGPRG